MSKVIEETVKALSEFESLLDAAMAGATEAKSRMSKDASEWGEMAKAKAIAKAQSMAAATVDKARAEATKDAAEIKKKGEAEMGKFEVSMVKHKAEAVELVTRRLMGESE